MDSSERPGGFARVFFLSTTEKRAPHRMRTVLDLILAKEGFGYGLLI